MTRRGWITGGALLVARLLSAQPPEVDEQRAAWQYRRAVTVRAEPGKGFASLAMPPEVGARCQPDLRDVRLVSGDGGEVQYVVDRAVEREVIPIWNGRLVDTVREKKTRTSWVVDLGAAREFDRMNLDVRERDFAKRVLVEVSEDGRAWRAIEPDAGIFDRAWAGGQIHHTTVALPDRVTARYVRLTADDRRSKPLDVYGVAVSAARRVAADEWRRPVAMERLQTEGGVTRYRLDLPSRFPLESFQLESDDPAFARRVVLSEVRMRNDRLEEVVLGDAYLYRVRIEDEDLSAEALLLPLRSKPQGGELVLDVHDGDSPPLRVARGVASSPATRVIFPVLPGALTLYYGNEATRAPLYDIEALRWRLGVSPAFAGSALGAEAENPRYRRALPIPPAAPRGAVLGVPRWKAMRRVNIAGREDLYTLTLAGADLALLRSDLGDLRIVDDQDRQVPCIVEPAASEARVALTVERDDRPARRAEGNLTRYRLTVPDATTGRTLALPLATVELTFREGFFSRPARLLAPPPRGSRAGERLLASTVLSRGGGPSGGGPIRLALAGTREPELVLEINEGDNAPLTLAEARGVVRVPRVAFKADPGAYRVLLGNGEAEPPRYDIASLRQEILSYSAVVVQADSAAPNPAYRRRAGDYFKEAPPTLLLWGALAGAVLALLLLTARILRQPPASAPP